MENLDLNKFISEMPKDSENLKDYFNLLKGNLEKATNTVNRMTLLIIILFIGYLTILYSEEKRISFLGISIGSIDLVIILMPVIFGFVIYRTYQFFLFKQRLITAYQLVCSKLFNIKLDNNIIPLISPFETTDGISLNLPKSTKGSLLFSLLIIPGLLLFGISPLVIQIMLIIEVATYHGNLGFLANVSFGIASYITVILIFTIYFTVISNIRDIKNRNKNSA